MMVASFRQSCWEVLAVLGPTKMARNALGALGHLGQLTWPSGHILYRLPLRGPSRDLNKKQDSSSKTRPRWLQEPSANHTGATTHAHARTHGCTYKRARTLVLGRGFTCMHTRVAQSIERGADPGGDRQRKNLIRETRHSILRIFFVDRRFV